MANSASPLATLHRGVNRLDMPNAAGDTILWVYFTVDTARHARHVAATLVAEGLAACTNVHQTHTAYYMWEGELRTDDEVAVVAKTTAARFEALRQRVRAMPGHSLPAMLALPALTGDAEFMAWVRDAVRDAPPASLAL